MSKTEVSILHPLNLTEELISDEQLESLAGIELADCTSGTTEKCTCGGDATCHHHNPLEEFI